MTQKELLKIASDTELMSILEKISLIQSDLQYKTVYEQKTAMKDMKHYAKIIISYLNEAN